MMGSPYDSSATATPRETEAAVTVRLGPVAATALSASGPDPLPTALLQAIGYYLGAGRESAGWAFPKFLVPDSEPAGTVTASLERTAWDQIVAEAERQGVEPDALLQHAAIFFAAARDAGRLSDRALEQLAREPLSSTRGSTR